MPEVLVVQERRTEYSAGMSTEKRNRRIRQIEEDLQRSLRTRYRGRIVAVEPRTGQYFIGRTLLEALGKARKQIPKSPLYFLRVGSPFAYQQHGIGSS